MSDDNIPISWPVLPQREKYRKNVDLPTESEQLVEKSVVNVGALDDSAAVSHDDVKQTGGWEFLDHTADVQIHAWGVDIEEAFGAAAAAMFAYMVDIADIDSSLTRSIIASGHDWASLLFAFLDECLFVFHTDALAMTRVVVDSIDTDEWTIRATVHGGVFDPKRHGQGTEIKAITYSNMQIILPTEKASTSFAQDRRAQIFVIVDI